MRVLSVQQPWAALIVAGLKDVENRTWVPATDVFSEPLLIHASLGVDRSINVDKLLAGLTDTRGAIVGSVRVHDIVQDSTSQWAQDGCYHWLLYGAVRFMRPIPCRGHLGLWKPPDDLAPKIRREARRL